MGQAIPGVVPATEKEATVMVTWPSLAATGYGCTWGRIYESEVGINLLGIPVTFGRIMALVSIPAILPMYFHMLVPKLPFVVAGVPNPWCLRYRLTNRRVLVEQPFGGGEQRSVSLDRFDSIEPEQQPGQAWYKAADLVFKNGDVETFRLPGVAHPQSFLSTCMKARAGFVGVQMARQSGAAV
ncbi:MAG: PH domain-containing protein [Planctomycetota bacterium]